MSAFVDAVNYPDPYDNPGDVEQILNPETQLPYNTGEEWYYPGRNATAGGVTSLRSNWFTLNCKEAEDLPTADFKPSKFVGKDKLVILTDGTCGSTCASFTKVRST
jgi:hypothetical protein